MRMLNYLYTVLAAMALVSAAVKKIGLNSQNQAVLFGSKVVLSCPKPSSRGLVQWIKDKLEISQEYLFESNRHKLLENKDQNEYWLEIDPILFEDEGEYSCKVSSGHKEWALEFNLTNLTVLAPSEPIKSRQEKFLIIREGVEIELTCTLFGQELPLKITWFDDMGKMLSENKDFKVELLSNSQKVAAKSTLKVVANRRHHNTTFTCLAQNPVDYNQSTEIHLQVQYAPSVKVEIIAGSEATGMIREYTDAVFMCQTDANPPVVNYSWFIEEELVEHESELKFVVPSVAREFHGAKVQCQASNTVGESRGFFTMNITYSPRFRSRSYSIEAEMGALVPLICEAEGNPPPKYVWIHKATENIVGTSRNISVILDSESHGVYYCKVCVTGFPEIHAMYSVLIRGRLEKVYNILTISIAASIVIGILLSVTIGLACAIPRKVWK